VEVVRALRFVGWLIVLVVLACGAAVIGVILSALIAGH
jgi:hypothetical protein